MTTHGVSWMRQVNWLPSPLPSLFVVNMNGIVPLADTETLPTTSSVFAKGTDEYHEARHYLEYKFSKLLLIGLSGPLRRIKVSALAA